MTTATATEVVANDYFGNQIEVGDTIVYPGRQGSSLWMNHMVVTKVTGLPDSFRPDRLHLRVTGKSRQGVDGPERTSTLTEVDRVVIIAKGN